VPVSLGCCAGGGPFGKRPEFKPGEKVGEAREPFQAGRLRKRFALRSMETRNRAEDERRAIGQRRTAGLNRAYPSFAA
jgi:hypothetical protein